MKKLLLLILIPVALFVSCEEEFSPYGEFKDKYIFTCVLKSDTAYQFATLFHNYKPAGYDPLTFTEDPAIKGADIRILYQDSVYILKDTTTVQADTSRYNFPFSFYYNNKFAIAPNRQIEVEVLLPNGRRLKASSITPGEIRFQDRSDVIIPPVASGFVQFYWNGLGEGTFFRPYLAVKYKVNENGNIVEKEKEIPLRFVQQNGEQKPVFPSAGNSVTAVYQMDAINKTLQDISEGDPDKENYSVYQSAIFKLAAYDLPLSRYVSSTSQSLDDLTVTINSSDYTNVEGGLGIFGSYYSKRYDRIRFINQYITSFGYNFITEN